MAENILSKKYKLVVIGGSAGSMEVILGILAGLKRTLTLAIVIVLHRKKNGESLLVDLFSSRTSLVVKEAEEKEKILPGHIYIAPADYHLLIEKDFTFSLDFSEKVHYSRPSIDVTFETAAEAYGESLICILLSGANADGALGVKKAKDAKGLTMVQNPEDAEVSFMPAQAIAIAQVDLIVNGAEIGAIINNLSAQ